MTINTFGAGAHTLVVTLAEDAWAGDAQANVALDGTPLNAAPLTVTASHAAGASEAFTFKGNWTAGAHTVAISFLNDAYGGTPGEDRNLYVVGITMDGVASPDLANGTVEMPWTATNTFGVSVAAPVSAPAATVAALVASPADMTTLAEALAPLVATALQPQVQAIQAAMQAAIQQTLVGQAETATQLPAAGAFSAADSLAIVQGDADVLANMGALKAYMQKAGN